MTLDIRSMRPFFSQDALYEYRLPMRLTGVNLQDCAARASHFFLMSSVGFVHLRTVRTCGLLAPGTITVLLKDHIPA